MLVHVGALAISMPRISAFHSLIGARLSAGQRKLVTTLEPRRNLLLMATQTSSYSSTVSAQTPVPRAAVSVVVRYDRHGNGKDTPKDDRQHSSTKKQPAYLLIERGNPPNKGVWCVPGGKIDMGETTLNAAKRELEEEVKFTDENDQDVKLAWYSGAFCTSDSIIKGNAETGKLGYHYLIAQCFAEIVIPNDSNEAASDIPPRVKPADDAVGAKWWTLDEIREAEARKLTVPNLVVVIERAEALYQCGMLPTTHSMTVPT